MASDPTGTELLPSSPKHGAVVGLGSDTNTDASSLMTLAGLL